MMRRNRARERWFWAVQAVTTARVLLTFGFIVLAPFENLWIVAGAMYLGAGLSDVLDGRLARAKRVVSKVGGALDVFGDRYFLVVSCLYAGFRGVSLIPLSIIVMRELYSVSLRMVQIDGKGVMLHNRTLGGAVHACVAMATFGFIISPMEHPSRFFYYPYYGIAVLYVFYLPYSIYVSRHNINVSVTEDLGGNAGEHSQD